MSSAGAKTGGKPGASVIHQGAIVVLVVRGHKKWNPTCPVKPSVTGGMKPGWTGSRQARTSPCNSAQTQPVLPALIFPNLASQLTPSTTTSTHVLRDTATSPGDHHFHQLSGFPRPLQ